ncbi:MAG: hypothetical protein ACI9C1_001869 [Candidatus Aldehydirespiratoraceae bacterium]
MKVKDAIQITDLKDATHPRLRHDEPQIAIKDTDTLQCANHHTQAKRIDEVDTGEIKHELMISHPNLGHDRLAKVGPTHHIKLARDSDDSPRPFLV